jgi:hypothetical protein
MLSPRRLALGSAVGLLSVAAAFLPRPLPGEVPDLIPSRSAEAPSPTWQSLAALTAGGGPRWERFEAAAAADLARAQAQGRAQGYAAPPFATTPVAPPCFRAVEMQGDLPYDDTFEDNLARADSALVGRVTGSKPGFLFLNFGTLYELEIERDLKMETASSLPQRLLLFYPAADAEIDGVRWCVLHPWRADHPRIGGRALLLRFAVPTGLPADLVWMDDRGLFFDSSARGLSVPRYYRDLAGLEKLSIDFLVQRAQELLDRQAEGRKP